MCLSRRLDVGDGRFGDPGQTAERVAGTAEEVVDLAAEQRNRSGLGSLGVEDLDGFFNRSNAREAVAAHEAVVEERQR